MTMAEDMTATCPADDHGPTPAVTATEARQAVIRVVRQGRAPWTRRDRRGRPAPDRTGAAAGPPSDDPRRRGGRPRREVAAAVGTARRPHPLGLRLGVLDPGGAQTGR